MFDEDNSVGTSESETETTDVSRQQQTVDTGIGVERLYSGVSLVGIHRPVEAHVGDFRHQSLEQVRLDDLNHLFHLAEDEDSMTRECATAIDQVLRLVVFLTSDAAVVKDLPKGETVQFNAQPR